MAGWRIGGERGGDGNGDGDGEALFFSVMEERWGGREGEGEGDESVSVRVERGK